MVRLLRILLFPISVLYGVVMALRNVLFSIGIFESKSFDVPIVSIGNITVGGTGKTPHTEYVINLLKEKSDIAVLSRGYGRKTKGFVEVDVDSTAELCGDEPCQMKRKFSQQSVVVCENRREGITQILKRFKPDVVVMDDAYQHRWVKPGLSILLVDYNRPIFKDFIMPTGELREFPCGSQRADVVIVSKCPSDISEGEKRYYNEKLRIEDNQNLFFSSFVYGVLMPVFSAHRAEGLKDCEVVLLTGIANPKPLMAYVEELGARVSVLSFPDHYQFTSQDMDTIVDSLLALDPQNRCIVTTEKDAVRLRSGLDVPQLIKENLFYIPIQVEVLEKELELHKIIESYVTKN